MGKAVNPLHKEEGKTREPEVIGEEGDNEKNDLPKDFKFSHGLTSEEAATLMKIHGRNMLPEKIVPKWYIFVSQL